MTRALVTYGDWVSLIGEEDRCTSDMYDSLVNGRFEKIASLMIFTLVQDYCSRCLNRETKRFNIALGQEGGSDVDSVILLSSRYSRLCNRLLFFADVEGFPAKEGRLLYDEIVSYVSGVFSSLKRDFEKTEGQAGEDVVWHLKKLEKHWLKK